MKRLLIATVAIALIAVDATSFDDPWTGKKELDKITLKQIKIDAKVDDLDKKIKVKKEAKKKLDAKKKTFDDEADAEQKKLDDDKSKNLLKSTEKTAIKEKKAKALEESGKVLKEITPVQKELTALEKNKTELEGEWTKNDDAMSKLNPGMSVGDASVAWIGGRLAKGKRIFLVSEVLSGSHLKGFEGFSKKLGLQLKSWAKVLKEDQAALTTAKAVKPATDDSKAKITVYTDREKADKLSTKAITDYQKYLDETIIKEWKAAVVAEEDYTPLPKAFEQAEAQYHEDYLTATVAQAKSIIALEKGNSAKKAEMDKIEAYYKVLEKNLPKAKSKLEEATKAAEAEKSGMGWLWGLLAALVGAVGVFCIWKKCKDKKDGAEDDGKNK